MDEKTLSKLDEALEKNNIKLSDLIDHEQEFELIRLARLGIWAEKHAIPALRKNKNDQSCDECEADVVAMLAISHLPKDTNNE